jgi:aspyridone synthetase trans-acting enoyl reductase
MELPATQQVLKVAGPNRLVLQSDCPLPTLEADEVLVRVRCVSVNPVDAKMLDLAPHVGATAGCEFAGDVVAVGVAVRNQKVRVGVAVFGCCFGNHPERADNGAYAAYVAALGDLVYLLPPHMSYSAAVSLGAALPTVGLAIYSASAWPLPPPSIGSPPASGPSREAAGLEIEAAKAKAKVGRYVLVYGASTVSGALALQMLRLSGMVPVAVCSRANFPCVTGRGADAAFDYHDASCADDIRRYTGGSLAYALDCIADLASMKICYAALGPAGGKYTALNPFPLRGHTRRDVRPDYVLCYTIFGKPMPLPRPFGRPARPKDRAFAEAWCELTQPLVDTPGILLPHPVSQHSGLAEISAGLDCMRQGKVSATKLVYEL